jgi:hypothetical protein
MLSTIACGIGAISIISGAIHTYAILSMGKDYDRDLVFLLFAGGVLMFCGSLNILTRNGVRKNVRLANTVSILSTIFLVVFCLSLIPFFKAKLNYLLICIHISYLFIFALVTLMKKENSISQ